MSIFKETASIPVMEAFATKTYRRRRPRGEPVYQQGKSYTKGGRNIKEFKDWLKDVYGFVPRPGDAAIRAGTDTDDYHAETEKVLVAKSAARRGVNVRWQPDTSSHKKFASRKQSYDYNTFAVVGYAKRLGFPVLWVIKPNGGNYYAMSKTLLKHWDMTFQNRMWTRSDVEEMIEDSNFSEKFMLDEVLKNS